MTKIEDRQIDEIINALNGPPAGENAKQPMGAKPLITIDDFKKIELKLARILSAERVPKSDKLIKMQIEIGPERRQIVAGIAQHFKPEDLVGRFVVVVANLQPAKLMGQESQGMLLAASDNRGKFALLTVNADLESGSIIK